MRLPIVITQLALAGVALGAGAACSKLHVLVASGAAGPPHGYGLLNTTIEAIRSAIPGTTNFSVAYDKADPDPTTLKVGVDNYRSALKQYVADCPKTPLVLLGYSSGAIIVGDSLCGKNFNKSTADPPLPANYETHIIASVFYGDERFVPQKAFDRGTCKKGHGINPRTNLFQCGSFTPRWRSWVDSHDEESCIFSGAVPISSVHTSYPSKYDTALKNYVVQQYRKLVT